MSKELSNPRINVGDVFKTNGSGDVVIIKYNNANDIVVKFDDGYVRKTTSGNLQKGKVRNPTKPLITSASNDPIVIGKQYVNTGGYAFTPVKYRNCSEVDVVFESGYSTTTTAQHVRDGGILDLLSPSVRGVGILGVGEFKTGSKGYSQWVAMICRTHSELYKSRFPTYRNASVCSAWLNFQVFAKWCSEQPEFYLEKSVLEKDILLKNNKHYSPETCCFVPHQINALFTKCNVNRGSYPIGVYWSEKDTSLRACINIRGINKDLGKHDSAYKAFMAYKVAKESHIKSMSETYRHRISEACYQALQNYVVEITD